MIEPGTSAVRAEVAEAGGEDVSRAVATAYRTFEGGVVAADTTDARDPGGFPAEARRGGLDHRVDFAVAQCGRLPAARALVVQLVSAQQRRHLEQMLVVVAPARSVGRAVAQDRADDTVLGAGGWVRDGHLGGGFLHEKVSQA